MIAPFLPEIRFPSHASADEGFRRWREAILWACGTTGGPGVVVENAASGPRMRVKERRRAFFRLYGSANPYAGSQVHASAGGGWDDTAAGLTSSSLYEENNTTGLDGKVVEAYLVQGEWRFRYLRSGTPEPPPLCGCGIPRSLWIGLWPKGRTDPGDTSGCDGDYTYTPFPWPLTWQPRPGDLPAVIGNYDVAHGAACRPFPVSDEAWFAGPFDAVYGTYCPLTKPTRIYFWAYVSHCVLYLWRIFITDTDPYALVPNRECNPVITGGSSGYGFFGCDPWETGEIGYTLTHLGVGQFQGLGLYVYGTPGEDDIPTDNAGSAGIP